MALLAGLFARFARPQPDAAVSAASALYRAIVVQSRQPGFYLRLAVPDTPDGRFDVLMVHAALVLRRLRRDHAAAERTAQALFDLMFDDMDENLREMGVGDLAVGKRVKGMAQALYGRLAAYGDGLDAGDAQALTEAVMRNVYRATAVPDTTARSFADYMISAADHLDRTTTEILLSGMLSFPAAPAAP